MPFTLKLGPIIFTFSPNPELLLKHRILLVQKNSVDVDIKRTQGNSKGLRLVKISIFVVATPLYKVEIITRQTDSFDQATACFKDKEIKRLFLTVTGNRNP